MSLWQIDVVRWAPSWMTIPERLLLFSLVYALKPDVYLEIGTHWGGSALIVRHALPEATIVCVDPKPEIKHWTEVLIKPILIEGKSPGALQDAREAAGQPFDFVLIDGDHSHDAVMADVLGVLPHLSPLAWLLFHDCLNPEVGWVIDLVVAFESMVDCGVLSVEPSYDKGETWGGMRLVRFNAAQIVRWDYEKA